MCSARLDQGWGSPIKRVQARPTLIRECVAGQQTESCSVIDSILSVQVDQRRRCRWLRWSQREHTPREVQRVAATVRKEWDTVHQRVYCPYGISRPSLQRDCKWRSKWINPGDQLPKCGIEWTNDKISANSKQTRWLWIHWKSLNKVGFSFSIDTLILVRKRSSNFIRRLRIIMTRRSWLSFSNLQNLNPSRRTKKVRHLLWWLSTTASQ